MTTTPELGITELATNADGRTVFNDAARRLEQFANVVRVISVTTVTPPGSPNDGDAYYVGGTGTGAWVGFDDTVAYYASNSWISVTLSEGVTLYDSTNNDWFKFNGTDLDRFFERTYQVTLFTPTASEDRTVVYLEHELDLLELNSVCRGTTPSLTWTLRYNADRSATGTEVITSGHATTTTTTVDSLTSFTNSQVPTLTFLWFETTATSGTVDEFHLTIRGLSPR